MTKRPFVSVGVQLLLISVVSALASYAIGHWVFTNQGPFLPLAFFIGFFWLGMEWVFLKPLRRLIASFDKMSLDQIPTFPFQARADEWGFLSRALQRLWNAVTNQRQEAQLLLDSAELWRSQTDLRNTVNHSLASVLHRYGLASVLLFWVEEGSQRLKALYWAGCSDEFGARLNPLIEEGLVGSVYRSASAQRVSSDQLSNDPVLQTFLERQQAQSIFLAPCIVEGRARGVAVFVSKDETAFVETDQNDLAVYAGHICLAIHQASQLDQLRQANHSLESQHQMLLQELQQTQAKLSQKIRELKTVYELALETAAAADVEKIIRVIIEGVKELVGAQRAAFFLLDRARGQLEPLAPAFDLPAAITPTLCASLSDTELIKGILQTGQPQILHFIESPDIIPAPWRYVDIRSMVVLPLRSGESIEGFFCVVNKLNGLFSTDDVKLLSLLTSRVTEVLHRLTVDQQLRQRVQDLSTLQEIASQLPSPPVLTDTVEVIGQISRKALPGTTLCIFFLPQPEKDMLVMMGGDWDPTVAFDGKALSISLGEKTALQRVFQEGQAASYEQAGTPDAFWENEAILRMLPLQELMYLPLVVERRTIGVMVIGSVKRGTLTPEYRRLSTLIAEQVAVMIERSRLYERLLSANEKLEQINHLKNEFITMVSHELRTPLTTIKGFVTIVLNEETGPINDQQRHFLNTSDRAIDRLSLLVSDLLDISRIEAGQIKMQLRPLDLNELLHRAGHNFMPQMKTKSLVLTMNISERLPMVMGDAHRLTQVVDNLLTNALKFTEKGGITITALDKGDYVLVSVRDTGPGIPKKELEKIFEKFYQVKIGNVSPAKGTGLGLSIARSIIESHHGKIWVDSESGQGSDFRFIIPRARSESTTEDVLSPSAVSPTPST